MSEPIMVTVTVPTREEAEKIGRILVNSRLAACTQIMGPITSIFRWKGKVEEVEEWFCYVKSTEENLDELTKLIKSNHSYEVPEVVAIPILGGNPDYLDWLNDETS